MAFVNIMGIEAVVVSFFDGVVEGVGMGKGPNSMILVEEEGEGMVVLGFAEFMPDVGAGHEGDLALGIAVAEEDKDGFFSVGGFGGLCFGGSDFVAFAG